MLLSPILLAARRARDEPAQCPGPVRRRRRPRRSSTTWRSSARRSCSPRRMGCTAWRSASWPVRPVTSAIQLLPLRQTGFRWTPRIDLGDPSARQALLLMVPRAVGLGASQLTFLVATSLASSLGVGAVTAFSIAFSIFQIPIGVIGIPIGVVMLPSMSRELARGDVAQLREPRRTRAAADPVRDAAADRPDDRAADRDRDRSCSATAGSTSTAWR